MAALADKAEAELVMAKDEYRPPRRYERSRPRYTLVEMILVTVIVAMTVTVLRLVSWLITWFRNRKKKQIVPRMILGTEKDADRVSLGDD